MLLEYNFTFAKKILCSLSLSLSILSTIYMFFPLQKVSAASGSVVDRLTDTSKYTGSHKERFDASGKGKGIEGRADPAAGSGNGYVSGYKAGGSYGK